MVNYYKDVDFDKSIYYVDYDNDEVVESTLGDLCSEFVDTTTTPIGVAARYHLRNNGGRTLDFNKVEGWEVWTWGHAGNNPRIVESFDSHEAAGHALSMLAKYYLDESTESPYYYDNKEDALSELDDNDLED